MSLIEVDYTDRTITMFKGLGGFEGFVLQCSHAQTRPKLFKTYSVTGFEHDFNKGKQQLPEIIGEWFDLNNTEIIGYMQGECISVEPKLTWFHFLRVQKVNTTKHPITKRKRTTVLAWTENNYKAPALLICKTK